ncbi:MAG TPA: hypothetical protein IGS53_27570 [Leptolyngbyaceae cyanobacterium M33_DOE_097]|uniref:Uncharacterized protein n=1 Tax=Oscillatoriales cyanobacterium SpSt-418 TaxID=2282169 RepID=A0A7C3KBK0_9CYAN|nr:hypothetical protein [Leptolyngbyaceae cyanobacterium M33_DOE_097]
MSLSPQVAYENLAQLEQVDVVKSAFYRQLANEILADTRVSLRWRQAIADRLNSVNNWLAMQTIGDKDDSY